LCFVCGQLILCFDLLFSSILVCGFWVPRSSAVCPGSSCGTWLWLLLSVCPAWYFLVRDSSVGNVIMVLVFSWRWVSFWFPLQVAPWFRFTAGGFAFLYSCSGFRTLDLFLVEFPGPSFYSSQCSWLWWSAVGKCHRVPSTQPQSCLRFTVPSIWFFSLTISSPPAAWLFCPGVRFSNPGSSILISALNRRCKSIFVTHCWIY
jgi:hypothetical protein